MKKKINWKKIAMIGGVFAVGMVVGALGGEKLLSYLSLKDICELEIKPFIENGKTCFQYTLTSSETGRKLSTVCSKEFIESAMKLSEGPVSNSELFDIIFR